MSDGQQSPAWSPAVGTGLLQLPKAAGVVEYSGCRDVAVVTASSSVRRPDPSERSVPTNSAVVRRDPAEGRGSRLINRLQKNVPDVHDEVDGGDKAQKTAPNVFGSS